MNPTVERSNMTSVEADTSTYCNFELEERFTCLMCPVKAVYDWTELQIHCENVHFWYQNKKHAVFPKLVAAGFVSFIEQRRCFCCKRCSHGFVLNSDVEENVRILRKHEKECKNLSSDEETCIDLHLETLRRVSRPKRSIPPPPPPPKISGLELNLTELNSPGPSSRLSFQFNPVPQVPRTSGSDVAVDVCKESDQNIPLPPLSPQLEVDVETHREGESELRPSRERLRKSPSKSREKKRAKRNNIRIPQIPLSPTLSINTADSDSRRECERRESVPENRLTEGRNNKMLKGTRSFGSAGSGLGFEIEAVHYNFPQGPGHGETIAGINGNRKKPLSDFPGFTIEEVKSAPPPFKKRRKTVSTSSEPASTSLTNRPKAESSRSSVTALPVMEKNTECRLGILTRPKRTCEKPPKYSEYGIRIPTAPSTISGFQTLPKTRKNEPLTSQRSMKTQVGGIRKTEVTPMKSTPEVAMVPAKNVGQAQQKVKNNPNVELEAISVAGTRLHQSSSQTEDGAGRSRNSGKESEEERREREKVKKLLKKILDSAINFTNRRGRKLSAAFYKLPSRKELPEYYDVIQKPIDIRMISANIDCNKYTSVDELEADFMLLCNNVQRYNKKKSMIYSDSVVLESVFVKARQDFEAEATSG